MYFVTVGTIAAPFSRLITALSSLPFSIKELVFYQGFVPPDTPIDFDHQFLFSRKDFSALIKRSKLIICHAGIGTIFDCYNSGKPAIIVPRRATFGEHLNNHQLEICNQLIIHPLPNIHVCFDLATLEEKIYDALRRFDQNSLNQRIDTMSQLRDAIKFECLSIQKRLESS